MVFLTKNIYFYIEGEPTSPSQNGKISLSPSCGLLVGIYIFHGNWSIETFRKKLIPKLILFVSGS
jgi:hypothetical protein